VFLDTSFKFCIFSNLEVKTLFYLNNLNISTALSLIQ
jgi:hypothetical protein